MKKNKKIKKVQKGRQVNLENKIMEEINRGKVRMKPRWWFWAKEWGLRSFVGIAMVGVGLLFLAIAYVLDANSAWELLDFGDLGKEMFIQNFPYVFLAGSVALLIVSMIGFGKVGENYKRTKLTLLGMVLGVTVVITVLLFGVKWKLGG